MNFSSQENVYQYENQEEYLNKINTSSQELLIDEYNKKQLIPNCNSYNVLDNINSPSTFRQIIFDQELKKT
jgi:hypothetical protein